MLTAFGAIGRSDWKRLLRIRLKKQKEFFHRRERGDLLLYINLASRGIPYVHRYFYNVFACNDVTELSSNQRVDELVLNYVTQLRQSLFGFYLLDDDALPAMTDVFFGAGAMISAMTGRPAGFANQTSWCKAGLDWDSIGKLGFERGNPWIEFSIKVYRALWRFWEEDYCVGGYRYHSPLDAAWAVRGSDLFAEMYSEKERVLELIAWCQDWIARMQACLEGETNSPSGYRAIIGTLIPDGAVWVNGDAVDLISAEFARDFEVAASSSLFRSMGGGFYHHHSIGVQDRRLGRAAHLQRLSCRTGSGRSPDSKRRTKGRCGRGFSVGAGHDRSIPLKALVGLAPADPRRAVYPIRGLRRPRRCPALHP